MALSQSRGCFQGLSIRFSQPELPLRPVHAAARRQRLVVRAQQQPQQDSIPLQLNQLIERLSKYDFLSTGLGAACVTSVCVAQGQNPFFALWLTFCATVAALAVNELLPEEW